MRLSLLVIAIAVVALLASAGTEARVASASEVGPLVGDADCNSAIDGLDALGVVGHVADTGAAPACLSLADVNCDGTVDLLDMVELLRHAAELPPGNIPQECAQIGSVAGLPTLAVSVDGSIEPPPDIPGIDGIGPARPLAVIEDEDDNKTVFVANELVIVTDDTNVLNDFLSRWQATLVKTLNPSDYDIDMPQIHLVRLDPNGVDTSHLADDLRKVNAVSWGDFRVSNQDAAALLAVALGEAAGGMQLDLNWVVQGSTYDQRDVREAASGPGGWNPNPYTWTYMNRGSAQDTGVGDAWRALAAADKLGNKVKVSILDGGFTPNADFPAGYTVYGSTGVVNPATCTGGSACPWHGTTVTAAAMGVPNNNYGVAGPAGPIANAIITQSPSSDIVSYLQYIFLNLPSTALEGPDVINISAGSGLASEWCLTGLCLAMDGIMTGVRKLGMLVFAAAGNENTNVDAVKCVDLLLGSICYEKTIWIPCEVHDVICVGGLADNSTLKHSGSNWGTDVGSVDIFGPYVQYQTPNPDSGLKFGSCGTSCATPFVTGVAALIKAADPNLGADDIESILIANAHTGSGDSKVPRWVDAYHAIIAALGGNEPPEIHIEFSNGTAFGGIPAELSALVTDPEDRPFFGDPYNGQPAVQWTSNLDGSLGTGPVLSNVVLSYGIHFITATATDSAGSHIADVRTLNIINDLPTVSIVAPVDNSTFYEGQDVHLVATSHDLNYPSGHLNDGNLTWYLTPPASPNDRSNPLGNGHDLHVTLLEGDYNIVLVGTDDQAASSTDTASNIHVTAPPADLPPTAVIDSVDDSNACVNPTFEFVFTGHATDAVDGTLIGSSLVWTINGSTVGTGQTVHVPTAQMPVGDNAITLTATDSNSGTGTDSVPYHWDGCII